MKKIIFILVLFFWSRTFAQKIDTTSTFLDVTSYIKKILPHHDNNMPGDSIYGCYQGKGLDRIPLVLIIETKDIILVIQYKYTASGKVLERNSSVWILDSSRGYWLNKVPTRDAWKFKKMHDEVLEMMLKDPNLLINYQRAKFPYLRKGLFLFRAISSILNPICNNFSAVRFL